MRASSLIFVVIFAVWAASMLKHWVRRREDLATARTVDRFSEAMRMLERRTPVKADTSPRVKDEPKGTVLRPQVSVKKAKPAAVSAQAEAQVTGATAAPEMRGSETREASSVGRSAAEPGKSGRVRQASPQVKVGALVGSLALVVMTVVLAPLDVISAWFIPASFLLAVGVIAWLRHSAIAARAARGGVTRSSSRPSTSRTAQARPAARTAGPRAAATKAPRDAVAPARSSEPSDRAVHPDSTTTATERTSVPDTRSTASPLLVPAGPERAEEVVFDQDPAEQEPTDTVAQAQAEVFDARQWEPVDLPRPTYTMKAKAERDDVTPAATVDETDVRPLAARYENTPVDELPFDGMALDEDYDDLPQVFRAG